MAACVAAGRWRAALALYNRLRESGPAPDAFACNTALSACTAGGQWRRAMLILAAMGSEDSGAPSPPPPPRPRLRPRPRPRPRHRVCPRPRPRRHLHPTTHRARCPACVAPRPPTIPPTRHAGMSPDGISFTNAAKACDAAGEHDLADKLRAKRPAGRGRAGGRAGRGRGRAVRGDARGRRGGRGGRGLG